MLLRAQDGRRTKNFIPKNKQTIKRFRDGWLGVGEKYYYFLKNIFVPQTPLRVEFLLKTDSGYPKDTGVNKLWQPLGIPFPGTNFSQLWWGKKLAGNKRDMRRILDEKANRKA